MSAVSCEPFSEWERQQSEAEAKPVRFDPVGDLCRSKGHRQPHQRRHGGCAECYAEYHCPHNHLSGLKRLYGEGR